MSKSFEIAKKFLGKKVVVTIDRPIESKHPEHGFTYEVNYGYIKGVKAPDGEDLDAYFLEEKEPFEEKEGVCIAIIHRKDDDDDKLIVVSENIELTDEQIMEKVKFQEEWFDSKVVR